MPISQYRIIFLLLYIHVTWSAHDLKYAHLEDIQAECSPRDTCTEGSNTFTTSNCECDEQCHLYDDCCIDAPQPATLEDPVSNMKCISNGTGSYLGVYAINKCKEDWVGAMEIRRYCETANNASDPLLVAPYTDTQAKVTYKNAFCAECNDVNYATLRSWISSVTCGSLKAVNETGGISKELIIDQLAYKSTYPHRNKWGVYYKGSGRRETFYPCDLTFLLPDSVTKSVRFCRPNLVSTCPTNWRGKTTRQNCEAFMAAIYTDSRSYRNIHCANCNDANVSEVSCTTGVLTRKSSVPSSFSIIIDGFLNDGNVVGEIRQCRQGQIYDTFHKRCRSRGCALPGQRLVGDKCVKQ